RVLSTKKRLFGARSGLAAGGEASAAPLEVWKTRVAPLTLFRTPHSASRTPQQLPELGDLPAEMGHFSLQRGDPGAAFELQPFQLGQTPCVQLGGRPMLWVQTTQSFASSRCHVHAPSHPCRGISGACTEAGHGTWPLFRTIRRSSPTALGP